MSLSAAASRLAPSQEAEALLEQGHSQLAAGNATVAVACLTEACSMAMRDRIGEGAKVYFFALGMALQQCGRFAEAEKAYSDALRACPGWWAPRAALEELKKTVDSLNSSS